MPDWSRRHALQATGGALLTALAGCNDSDSAGGSSPRENRNTIEHVTVLKVRNTTPTPMVVHGRASRESGETTTEPAEPTTKEPPRHRGRLMEHVTDMDGEGMPAPRFPDDVQGADRFATFFEETDFETESIYLAQSPVPECYVRHLTGVYREADGVDAQFCREVRPADVACTADAYDMTAFAIRLPFAGDDFNSVGAGHGVAARDRGVTRSNPMSATSSAPTTVIRAAVRTEGPRRDGPPSVRLATPRTRHHRDDRRGRPRGLQRALERRGRGTRSA